MKRRKIQKLKSHDYFSTSRKLKWLDCKMCNEDGMLVSEDTKAFTCASCVSKMAAPPEIKAKPEEKRPRGWQFMSEYVSPSGKVYHKGREVNELVGSDTTDVAGDAAKPGRATKKKARGTTRSGQNAGRPNTGRNGRRRK